MGSTKTTTTNTQQHQENKSAPPSWTADGLANTANMVNQALAEVRAMPRYTGDFTATPGAALTQQIMDAYKGAGTASANAGGWLQDMAKGFGSSYEGPDAFTGYQLPTMKEFKPTDVAAWGGGTNGEQRLNSALTAAIQPVMRELQEKVLPGLRSSAIEAGAYSGDRAMSVLPGQAIAEAMTRANEVTQGLAYEGYQADQNRDLDAWKAFEANQLAANGQQNSFNLDSYNAIASALQGEATARNQAYGLATNRAQTTAQTSADLMRQGLQFQTAEGDLLREVLAQQMQRDQAGIDNAMARDSYDTQVPFRGLDIATNLLTALSGNWGTQTADMTGYSKTTEKTGGLGSILQGVLGGVSSLAGLGVFGPIGTAAGAASSIFGKKGGSTPQQLPANNWLMQA